MMDSDSEIEDLIESSESDEIFSSSNSDTDDDSLDDVRDWCPINTSARQPSPPKFPFSAKPGIKIPIVNADDPLDYFSYFFNDDVLSFIAKETNCYAKEYFENTNLTPSSRALDWEETNTEELMCFLALLLLQGIVQKPVEKWFWSKRPALSTPFFRQVMTEKRYGLIMKFLHFENKETYDDATSLNTKLRKVSDLHQMLVRSFKSAYTPNQTISIDESLIAFKGRLGWKQYIPSKRARFGIKLFQLCESESGYIWNSFIYTGKGTYCHEDYEIYGLSTKSVMTLIHDLKGQGYTLATDNYYTSPELAELLIQNKTDICGTLKKNRKGLPNGLKTSSIKKGEIIGFQKGKMCAMKWKDKKELFMLSTFHSLDMQQVESKKDSSKKAIKPEAVVWYNSSMGGVDRSDQCLSYYPVARNQQRKYYKKIFRFLLNQSVYNSYVLYKKNNGTLSHVSFRLQLIERLIEKGGIHSSHQYSKNVKTSENVLRLTARHFPSYVPNDSTKKKYPARLCKVCAEKRDDTGKRIRKESRFECKICDVGLCAVPCFEIYHTVSVF